MTMTTTPNTTPITGVTAATKIDARDGTARTRRGRERVVRRTTYTMALLLAMSVTTIPTTAAALPPLVGSGLDGADDLAPGDVGPRVVDVQEALLAGGVFLPGGADGVFGTATTKAIRDFQAWNGLERTGLLDAATVRRLERLPSGARSSGGDTSEGSVTASSSDTGRWTSLERFPVQGNCAYGDTWHAGRGGGRVHEGVDIIAGTGNLLYAVADGTITTRYWDQPGRISGNGLKLTAADGTYFVYLHLSGFAPGIELGTRVQAGDVIGFVGSTGSSATPHLHFEIHPGGGGAINPYPYVRAIDDCSDTRAQYQSSFG